MPIIDKHKEIKEYVDYSDPDIDVETTSSQWKKLTTTSRDLPQHDQARMFEMVLYLWRLNPLAHRSLCLARDFIVGDGITITANSPEVQKVLDHFWNGYPNNLDRYLPQIVLEFGLYGEILIPVGVNKANGSVEIGYLSPITITEVTVLPSNILIYDQVKVQAASSTDPDISLAVIKPDRDPNSDTFGYRMGDCFFYAINRTADSRRGLSDILSTADFLDAMDQLIFNSLERLTFETTWIWDVMLTGASEKQIKDKIQTIENRPMKPGSFNVHNEFEEWSPVNTGLQARNISDEAQMIRSYVFGGIGIPDFFFGDSENAGSYSETIAQPTYKTFRTRQNEIRGIISDMFSFVIDQKIIAGMLPKNVDRDFVIGMSPISLRDIQRTGGAMLRVLQSLQIATDLQIVSTEESREIFKALVDHLGLGTRIILKGSKETQPDA